METRRCPHRFHGNGRRRSLGRSVAADVACSGWPGGARDVAGLGHGPSGCGVWASLCWPWSPSEWPWPCRASWARTAGAWGGRCAGSHQEKSLCARVRGGHGRAAAMWSAPLGPWTGRSGVTSRLRQATWGPAHPMRVLPRSAGSWVWAPVPGMSRVDLGGRPPKARSSCHGPRLPTKPGSPALPAVLWLPGNGTVPATSTQECQGVRTPNSPPPGRRGQERQWSLWKQPSASQGQRKVTQARPSPRAGDLQEPAAVCS